MKYRCTMEPCGADLLLSRRRFDSRAGARHFHLDDINLKHTMCLSFNYLDVSEDEGVLHNEMMTPPASAGRIRMKGSIYDRSCVLLAFTCFASCLILYIYAAYLMFGRR